MQMGFTLSFFSIRTGQPVQTNHGTKREITVQKQAVAQWLKCHSKHGLLIKKEYKL